MTRHEATNWLKAQTGKNLDYDNYAGIQCVDFFNYYYLFLTGRNPYSDGYGVPGAKDLWNVSTSRFSKIANNPSDANQLPSPGDILIYNSKWGGGYGHVEMVLSADKNGVVVTGQRQNETNRAVTIVNRSWSQVVGGLIGWLSFNSFTTEQKLLPHQRIVGANGVNCRERATVNSTAVKEGVPGEVLDFKGYVRGEIVSANNIWFVGAYTGVYCWSGAFTDSSTNGLNDITPQAPIEIPPQPVEKPYSFTKDFNCVTEVIPAGTNNFEYGNFPAKPEKAVIHDFGTLGIDTYQSVVNTISKNGSRIVSAHFVVSGKKITQMVSLKDRAYHAGVNGNNFVGIETDPKQDQDTINSARTLLIELKNKYGYQLPLIKHSEIVTTACGDDVDLSKYDITPVPPTIPEPPVVPENPVPDTPEPPVEKPENGSGTLLDVIKSFVEQIINWLKSWRKDK